MCFTVMPPRFCAKIARFSTMKVSLMWHPWHQYICHKKNVKVISSLFSVNMSSLLLKPAGLAILGPYIPQLFCGCVKYR